eukprot:TRINITY_DN8818_c0_g1_i2.p2 TRINITY_DN8818_c0_g1~~TRINITY_DN8818_c0_g1_i2.p2  ORF type:complete len:238 (-),score=-19.74 TRINITY_DN8818_c0_g1_i2:187-900(-)
MQTYMHTICICMHIKLIHMHACQQHILACLLVRVQAQQSCLKYAFFHSQEMCKTCCNVPRKYIYKLFLFLYTNLGQKYKQNKYIQSFLILDFDDIITYRCTWVQIQQLNNIKSTQTLWIYIYIYKNFMIIFKNLRFPWFPSTYVYGNIIIHKKFVCNIQNDIYRVIYMFTIIYHSNISCAQNQLDLSSKVRSTFSGRSNVLERPARHVPCKMVQHVIPFFHIDILSKVHVPQCTYQS